MNIGLGIQGNVVVDHHGDPLHINTAGRHIRSHHHVHTARAQPFNHLLPLALHHVTIEGRAAVAMAIQRS